MALADILKQLGMIGAQGGQSLANAMQAQGNPLAFTQQQENLRQQVALKQQQQQAEAQSQQQDFLNQLGMAKGIAQGEFQQVPEGTPGAVSGAYEGGLNILPKAPQAFNIRKDSDLGHWLDLDTDINNIPMDDYLKMSQQAATLREKYNAQQNTRQAIDLAGMRLKQHINELYTPERYQKLYGTVDPDLATNRQLKLDQSDEAIAADKKLATGTTEINRMFEQVEKPTPWETRQLANQKTKETQDLESTRAKAIYDYEHPRPSDDEVKQWADRIEKEGADSGTISILKGIHPQMLSLVDKELSTRPPDENGVRPSIQAITTEMKNNHAKAGIALDTINQFMPTLESPGMKDTLGVASSRWQDFMAGKGMELNDNWKLVQDKLHFVSALLRNIHFGVRGGANVEIKKDFDKIANASTMNYETLHRGVQDFRDLLELYSREGLTPSSASGTDTSATAKKVRKYINVNGTLQLNPDYKEQ